MADAKGRKIFDERYEILAIVGRGACSVVYHARHAMAPASEVALKVLIKKGQNQAITGDKLRKEALAMVSCRHRFVVRLDDFHTVGELSYLSMEYAPHSDLRKFASTTGPTLSPKLGELFLLQSAEALGFVHKAGVIHRDIKPDNILVMSERECRLADFGVAVLPGEESSLEELRNGVGTMAYMAPEVLEGRGYDQRSDVYSLGVTFYELMTGRHPFDGAALVDQIAVRHDGGFPAPIDINPEIPTYISNAIMQALSFDPARRFPTGKEFQQTILVNRAQLKLDSSEDAAPARAPASPAKPAQTAPPRSAEPIRPVVTPTTPPGERRTSPIPQRAMPVQSPSSAGVVASVSLEPPRMVANAGPIAAAQPTPVAPAPVETRVPPGGLAAMALAGGGDRDETPRGRSDRPATPPSVGAKDLLGPKPSKRAELDPLKGPTTVKKEKSKQPPKRLGEPEKPPKISALSQKDPKKSFFMALSIAVFMVILMYGNIFLKKHYNIDIAQKLIDISFGGDDPTAPFIPQYAAPAPAFPMMPPGVYAGTITGLIPGQAVPLSIISFSEQGFMVFIPGIEGWSPTMVALESEQPEGAAALRITSNGFILDLSGHVVDGEISGYLKNVISGDEGEWRVRPTGK